MKIYLFENLDSTLISEKVTQLGHLVCDKVEEADAIIYGKDLQELLLSDINYQQSKYIISAKEFMKKEDPFAQYVIKFQTEFKATFKDESITEVTKRLEEGIESIYDSNSFSDLNRYLKLISLELVQNALIFGREQKDQWEVNFNIIRGEESYLISVSDHYGKLDRDKFYSSIRRAYQDKTYEMKKSGAGLGLSMILSASDELSIIRKESEFTQIRSIISKYKRLKEYKNKKTSLTFMEEF